MSNNCDNKTFSHIQVTLLHWAVTCVLKFACGDCKNCRVVC
jgi:hypothetical protein